MSNNRLYQAGDKRQGNSLPITPRKRQRIKEESPDRSPIAEFPVDRDRNDRSLHSENLTQLVNFFEKLNPSSAEDNQTINEFVIIYNVLFTYKSIQRAQMILNNSSETLKFAYKIKDFLMKYKLTVSNVVHDRELNTALQQVIKNYPGIPLLAGFKRPKTHRINTANETAKKKYVVSEKQIQTVIARMLALDQDNEDALLITKFVIIYNAIFEYKTPARARAFLKNNIHLSETEINDPMSLLKSKFLLTSTKMIFNRKLNTELKKIIKDQHNRPSLKTFQSEKQIQSPSLPYPVQTAQPSSQEEHDFPITSHNSAYQPYLPQLSQTISVTNYANSVSTHPPHQPRLPGYNFPTPNYSHNNLPCICQHYVQSMPVQNYHINQTPFPQNDHWAQQKDYPILHHAPRMSHYHAHHTYNAYWQQLPQSMSRENYANLEFSGHMEDYSNLVMPPQYNYPSLQTEYHFPTSSPPTPNINSSVIMPPSLPHTLTQEYSNLTHTDNFTFPDAYHSNPALTFPPPSPSSQHSELMSLSADELVNIFFQPSDF